MKYPWILFDLDGTLTDSRPGILRCVQYALEQCGMPEPDETKLYPFIGPPLFTSFQEFCGMDPERAAFAVEQYRIRFRKIGMFENSVYPGIPEMLQALRDAGAVLAVATSKPEVFTLQIMEHFHLSQYFQVIAGSDIQRDDQTKADIIRLAIERLQLTPEEQAQTVMVGDRKHDLIGAHTCGIPCIGVAYGYAPDGELEAYYADRIVSDTAALQNYLLS